MAFSVVLTLLAACSAVFAGPRSTQSGLSTDMIAKVKANLAQIATHSWEIGTELETLTELEWPALSVFGGSLPPPSTLSSGTAADVIALATSVVNNITTTTGPAPLINGDGAVGDPASIGTAVLLANWTRTDLTNEKYSTAASNQLAYLLDDAPRTSDGAISHRADQVQLWADFIYMAPPFIAYYGALQGGTDGSDLLELAYTQCKLYRQYLSSGGLWEHIVLGDSSDLNHWGTGNGWAAAGMLRVLETIRQSSFADDMLTERLDLTSWINEIITAAWSYQQSNGTLFNYIDQDASTTFADTSGTALLAAVTYRMATLTEDVTLVPAADKAFDLIQASLTDDGWLLGTVDPETFNTPSLPGSYSPEGQAFVLLLQSAWSDYNAALSRK